MSRPNRAISWSKHPQSKRRPGQLQSKDIAYLCSALLAAFCISISLDNLFLKACIPKFLPLIKGFKAFAVQCRRSQWKVRLLTRSGAQQGPTGDEIKAAWKYDSKTAIVICDPSSPNILNFQVSHSPANHSVQFRVHISSCLKIMKGMYCIEDVKEATADRQHFEGRPPTMLVYRQGVR